MSHKHAALRTSALLSLFCGSVWAQSNEIHAQLINSEQSVLAYASTQLLERSESAQKDFDYTRELLKATARNPAFSSQIHQKAAILDGWTEYLASDSTALARKPAPILPLDYRSAEAGASCEQAITMASGTGVRLEMAGSESIWMRITLAQAHGINISTRGSTVDAKVSVFADCRVTTKEPYVTADDNFGLQADAAVPAGKQLFWLAKIENVSTQPGNIVITAPSAVVITGTVRQSADQTAIPNVVIGVFRVDVSGFVNFERSATTTATGAYTISTNSSGTFALRTGSFNSERLGAYIPEAYDDRPCASNDIFNLSSCGTTGNNFTPVTLADPSSQMINFQLERSPVLIGSVTSSLNGATIASARVLIFDQNRNFVTDSFTDELGRYRIFAPVSPFYVGVDSDNFEAKLFDNVTCPNLNCVFSAATLLNLSQSQTQRADFQLKPERSILVNYTVNGVEPNDSFSGNVALLNSNGAQLIFNFFQSSSARIGPLSPGTYFLRTTSNSTVPNLYNGINCGSDCITELSSATPIVIGANTSSVSITANLKSLPRIEGRVSDSTNGEPIPNASLRLLSITGGNSFTVNSAVDGRYSIQSIRPGNYLLQAVSNTHTDELHDNISCESENPILECPGATIISVSNSSETRFINFNLQPTGRIRGKIPPSSGGNLFLFDSPGNRLKRIFVNSSFDGSYLARDIPVGPIVAGIALNGYEPQLFNQVNCNANPNNVDFSTCNFSAATVLSIAAASETTGVDFSPRRFGARLVRIVSAQSGQPIAGAIVDTWNASGQRLESKVTDATGSAWVFPNTFDNLGFYASTDNSAGHIEQVFQNRDCAAGSAFNGLCSLSIGSLIPFTGQANPTPIVFRLKPVGTQFVDGFED